MQFITILLTLPALAMSMSMAYSPGMCISGPSFALEAGVSVLAAVINGDFTQRCAATVGFADPDFLPVSYSFEPLPCSGRQVANFVLPKEVPNGEAYITWHCAGLTPACNYAKVSGGLGNPSMELQRQGTVGCVLEMLRTSTTFNTVTGPSSTLTEALSTVFTITTTSIPVKGTVITSAGDTVSTGNPEELSPKTPPSRTDTAPPGSGTQSATGENVSESLPTPTVDIKTESLFQGSSGTGSSTTTGTLSAIAASLFSTITVMQTVTTSSPTDDDMGRSETTGPPWLYRANLPLVRTEYFELGAEIDAVQRFIDGVRLRQEHRMVLAELDRLQETVNGVRLLFQEHLELRAKVDRLQRLIDLVEDWALSGSIAELGSEAEYRGLARRSLKEKERQRIVDILDNEGDEVAAGVENLLRKDVVHFLRVRTQLLSLLIAWEQVILEKKRYDEEGFRACGTAEGISPHQFMILFQTVFGRARAGLTNLGRDTPDLRMQAGVKRSIECDEAYPEPRTVKLYAPERSVSEINKEDGGLREDSNVECKRGGAEE
ncbi:hypothetical protein DL764_006019 [Monosporascus ibericus]|uniref:Uncharacterized protein n=1 Tax=Monosporascus ibericus TaxID=155417 RepID=A0A4Q4T8U1_9PEZI|nr:hypothetical protein DL764_006019 [Monosporascus ibericus]